MEINIKEAPGEGYVSEIGGLDAVGELSIRPGVGDRAKTAAAATLRTSEADDMSHITHSNQSRPHDDLYARDYYTGHLSKRGHCTSGG
jgi:hypothetical protein